MGLTQYVGVMGYWYNIIGENIMSFVCITPKGEYLISHIKEGRVKNSRVVQTIKDINCATIFKHEPRDMDTQSTKLFELCIRINAREERKVILTKE